MPIIKGPAGMDPILGKMRTKDVSGGTASGDYTFNTAEFTVGVAGLVSLNQVPASKLDTVSDIVNVTGASVTLQPNTAYKMYATTGALNVTANPPAVNKWAYEGHAEIFVGSVGYVVFDTSKIVLANQLEPDSVNNCTLRFHDGKCIISVEDHVAGYIVTVTSGTSAGSLYYGLGTASEEYIAVDAFLNGTTLDLGGVTTSAGEKHVVGNGYTETVVSGAINCTSKTTFANLGMSNVVVSSGTLTLGDVYIQNGATVGISGGGLAVEKVTGAGSDSVIDLGGGTAFINSNTTGVASAVCFTGGLRAVGGAINTYQGGYLSAYECIFSGNSATTRGGALGIYSSSTISGCTFVDNMAGLRAYGNAIYVSYPTLNIVDCNFSAEQTIVLTDYGKVVLRGSSVIDGIGPAPNASAGTVTISSGASINLTSSIAPGGGIVVDGACVVNGVEIAGGTYTSIVSSGGSAVVNE